MYVSYSSSTCLCASFVGWVSVGAKESPLLSSLNSSIDSLRLLRLCTIMVVCVVFLIKKDPMVCCILLLEDVECYASSFVVFFFGCDQGWVIFAVVALLLVFFGVLVLSCDGECC